MSGDRSTLRVLVVDDYLNMRLMVKNMLRQLGVREIDFAADGGAAIPELRARRYRLVISDWNMQPITGLELLEAVRKDPTLGWPRFIMLTGNSEAASRASEMGADATLLKPFSTIDLREAVSRAFPHG